VKAENDVRRRDDREATAVDNIDKTKLPAPMQVRGADFGKRSRTKWTHLVAEDTTFASPGMRARHGVRLVRGMPIRVVITAFDGIGCCHALSCCSGISWANKHDPLRQKFERKMAGTGDINTAGRVVRGVKRKDDERQ
jgi:hypothetical protein